MNAKKTATPLLEIRNLVVSVEKRDIVRGLSLTIREGEIHAIMGPNGSGKSTLVSALMGHPRYQIESGDVKFKGQNILEMSADERARAGMFLACQYPKEIAGVTLRDFLFAAYESQMKARDPSYKKLSPIRFASLLKEKMLALKMNEAFAERFVNQGFSGGEKKKAEILQMQLLMPSLALLDETDSGLDIDALKIVTEGVSHLRSPSFSALIVTHYARMLHYIEPDVVHVMVHGNIVESGSKDVAIKLEKEGYRNYESKSPGIRLERSSA